uniref:Uncharacterized protein n=1 Tax=Anguilla anguilla TaxID=7936 RepID=A0A0E9SB75_ANGAN
MQFYLRVISLSGKLRPLKAHRLYFFALRLLKPSLVRLDVGVETP